MTSKYTLEEVAEHNKPDDCWVIINDRVLDVTKFLEDHPGGDEKILEHAGFDFFSFFHNLNLFFIFFIIFLLFFFILFYFILFYFFFKSCSPEK